MARNAKAWLEQLEARLFASAAPARLLVFEWIDGDTIAVNGRPFRRLRRFCGCLRHLLKSSRSLTGNGRERFQDVAHLMSYALRCAMRH